MKGKKRLRGVTLLEILVAMVLLAVGLFTVFEIFPTGFAASYRSKCKVIASQLAQQELEDLRTFKGPNTCGVACQCNPEDNAENLAYFRCENSFHICLCQFDMGSWALPANWTAFTNNTKYFYNIQIDNVLDPYEKYKDFGTCQRITVRVRGPLNAASDWDNAGPGERRAVEVVLATYRTNRYLGATVLTTATTPATSGYQEIPVDNIRYFTVFKMENLSASEKYDTGPLEVFPGTGGSEDLIYHRNSLGLDNVIIDPGGANEQTNKIIGIKPNSDSNTTGRLILLNPIKMYSGTQLAAGTVVRYHMFIHRSSTI